METRSRQLNSDALTIFLCSFRHVLSSPLRSADQDRVLKKKFDDIASNNSVEFLQLFRPERYKKQQTSIHLRFKLKNRECNRARASAQKWNKSVSHENCLPFRRLHQFSHFALLNCFNCLWSTNRFWGANPSSARHNQIDLLIFIQKKYVIERDFSSRTLSDLSTSCLCAVKRIN